MITTAEIDASMCAELTYLYNADYNAKWVQNQNNVVGLCAFERAQELGYIRNVPGRITYVGRWYVELSQGGDND